MMQEYKRVTKLPPPPPVRPPTGDEIYLPIDRINEEFFERQEERLRNSLWYKPKHLIAFYTIRYCAYIYFIIYIALAFHHYVQMFVRT